MAPSKTALSHNIKFLRKRIGISQEELADRLKIKRSNIAAYESKNVEPRLRIILELAKIFDIEVASLIETKLDEGTLYSPFKHSSKSTTRQTPSLTKEDHKKVGLFIEKSQKIRKVLEGFRSFYAFRKQGSELLPPEKERIIYDIDNFIQLMDHLLKHNENLTAALSEISSSTNLEETY